MTTPDDTPENTLNPGPGKGKRGIILRNVRTKSLAGISVLLPYQQLTVITGPSGSGKTALLIDTLYSECRRLMGSGLAAAERREFFTTHFLHSLPELEEGLGYLPAINLSAEPPRGALHLGLGEYLGVHSQMSHIFSELGVPRCERDDADFLRADPESVISRVISGLRATADGLVLICADFPASFLAQLFPKSKVKKNAFELSAFLDAMFAAGYRRFLMGNELLSLQEDLTGTQFLKSYPEVMKTGFRVAVDSFSNSGDRGELTEELADRLREGIVLSNSLGGQSGVIITVTNRTEFQTTRRVPTASNVQLVSEGWFCSECGAKLSRITRNIAAHALKAEGDITPFVRAAVVTKKKAASSGFTLTLNGAPVSDYAKLSSRELADQVNSTFKTLSPQLSHLAETIKHQQAALKLLELDYLPLNRPLEELSDGELLKLKIANAVIGKLSQLLFILDEPSRTLHPHDLALVIQACKLLLQHGNTVVVAEKSGAFIKAADNLIALDKGCISTQAPLPAPEAEPKFELPPSQTENELQIPPRSIVALSGHSGSGKTRLLRSFVLDFKNQKKTKRSPDPRFAAFSSTVFVGDEFQLQPNSSRTRPETLASYTGLLELIAKLFSELSAARRAGLTAKDFSGKAPESRCPECAGKGFLIEELYYLGQTLSICEQCSGSGYTPRVLTVSFSGKSIREVLELTAVQALSLFPNAREIVEVLQRLVKFSLGEMPLGEPLSRISQSEKCRLVLMKVLSEAEKSRAPRGLLLLLDQPFTGLDDSELPPIFKELRAFLQKTESAALIVTHSTAVIGLCDYSLLSCRGASASSEIS